MLDGCSLTVSMVREGAASSTARSVIGFSMTFLLANVDGGRGPGGMGGLLEVTDHLHPKGLGKILGRKWKKMMTHWLMEEDALLTALDVTDLTAKWTCLVKRKRTQRMPKRRRIE